MGIITNNEHYIIFCLLLINPVVRGGVSDREKQMLWVCCMEWFLFTILLTERIGNARASA